MFYNSNRLLPFFSNNKTKQIAHGPSPFSSIAKKIWRVTLLRRLASSEWSMGTIKLSTAALSLVYSTAEYCAPFWYCSVHNRIIKSVLNDVLGIVIGCLRPTSKDHLPILSSIKLTELRQLGATLYLASGRTIDSDHTVYVKRIDWT